jgi:hypothetical protein
MNIIDFIKGLFSKQVDPPKEREVDQYDRLVNRIVNEIEPEIEIVYVTIGGVELEFSFN